MEVELAAGGTIGATTVRLEVTEAMKGKSSAKNKLYFHTLLEPGIEIGLKCKIVILS